MVVCCVDYFLELPHAWRYFAMRFNSILFPLKSFTLKLEFYLVNFMVSKLGIDFMLMVNLRYVHLVFFTFGI